MKKLWTKFINSGFSQKIEMVVTFLLVVGGICVLILNLSGLISFTEGELLSLVIALLCCIAVSRTLQDLDTVTDIYDAIKNSNKEIMELSSKVKNLNSTKELIVSRDNLDEKHNLTELWTGATEVRLLAIANTSFLGGNGVQHIKKAIKNGVHFNIISLDPDSDCVDAYKRSHIVSETSLPLENNLTTYKRHAIRDPLFRKNVILKITDYLIPYSMMIVMRNDDVLKIKVDLYGVDMDFMTRRSFYVSEDDSDNIEFYLKQWNAIWNNLEMTRIVEVTDKK